jgi:hypothetical protein
MAEKAEIADSDCPIDNLPCTVFYVEGCDVEYYSCTLCVASPFVCYKAFLRHNCQSTQSRLPQSCEIAAKRTMVEQHAYVAPLPLSDALMCSVEDSYTPRLLPGCFVRPARCRAEDVSEDVEQYLRQVFAVHVGSTSVTPQAAGSSGSSQPGVLKRWNPDAILAAMEIKRDASGARLFDTEDIPSSDRIKSFMTSLQRAYDAEVAAEEIEQRAIQHSENILIGKLSKLELNKLLSRSKEPLYMEDSD